MRETLPWAEGRLEIVFLLNTETVNEEQQSLCLVKWLCEQMMCCRSWTSEDKLESKSNSMRKAELKETSGSWGGEDHRSSRTVLLHPQLQKTPSNKTMCLQSCSRVWLFVTPWTPAHQAPLSIGILQPRVLEEVAPSCRGSSQPRDWTCISFVSCIGKHILYCLHHLGSNNAIVRLYSSTNFGPDILLLAAKSIQLDTTFIQKQDGGRGFMFLRAKHTGELQCWEPVYSQGPKVGRIISRLNNY